MPRPLAGIVAGRCGNSEHSPTAATRTLPASIVVPLVLAWGDTQELTEVAGGEGAGTHGSFVAGLRPGTTRTSFRGSQSCVQVYLTPLGASRVLGLPGREIAHRVTPLVDVSPALAGLADRLAETPTWAERLALVDRTLLALAHDGDAPDPLTRQVWHALRRSNGTARIHEVVRDTGRSPRTVTSRFTDATGLAPKTVARLLRFEHAGRAAGAGRPLADVAATTGYADQSHLTRDFAALAGISPRAWADRPPPTPRAALGAHP